MREFRKDEKKKNPQPRKRDEDSAILMHSNYEEVV